MSYTNGLDKPSDYFNTVLYTGNGGTLTVSGVGFQSDFTWLKGRSFADYHVLTDSVRGVNSQLYSNDVSIGTQTNGITSFNSDGFVLGNWSNTNKASNTHVSWNWKAGGSASSNTDGTQTSSVSVNQDAGFSIVTYTGGNTNDSSDNVGHGLGVIPSMIITKVTNGTTGWIVGHKDIGWNDQLVLNTTAAESVNNRSYGVNTNPTSSVFTVAQNGGDYITNSGGTFVSYCFAEKQGYSKFGSYTGNGNADGTFIYTGFKPAMIIVKQSSGTNSWHIMDNKRDTFNPLGNLLLPNSNAATNTVSANRFDFLSNGFKCRDTSGGTNASGQTYIYMAFAESPFVTSTGVPATAR